MTPEQEKRLLQAMYDRLFDLITYQPSNGRNPFNANETFVHFEKFGALSPNSFVNAKSPVNPTGSLAAAEYFSRMVDVVSPMSIEWDRKGQPLSGTFRKIVEAANAATTASEAQLKMYNKAYEYLNPEVEEKNPFTEEITTTRQTGKDYALFLENQANYIAQITAYRAGYNRYLLGMRSKDGDTVAKAEMDWQVAEPTLSNNIRMAYNKLTAGNAKFVQQALDIMNTSINDGIRRALELAKENVSDIHWNASSLGNNEKWLLAYGMPENWQSDDASALANFTEFTMSSENLQENSSSTEHKFSIDTSVNYGLWKVKASAEGERKETNRSMSGDKVEISAKIARVTIVRTWFDEFILRAGNWFTNLGPTDQSTGYISNGKMDSSNGGNLMPMYPVSFIVARDITIKAEFSSEEEKTLAEAYKGSASVGWGPFSIGGSYGYGHTEDSFKSEMQNGTIRVPGIQIIGWVSRLAPYSPSMSQADGQAKLSSAAK